MRTLKALALTPLVLRRLWLALNTVTLAGSIGSLTSRFSARDNSSRAVSLENAPSSISEIRFPVRSILFRVTVGMWRKNSSYFGCDVILFLLTRKGTCD